MSLLEVRDLNVEIAHASTSLRPVDRVSFAIRAGETVGLVGESGSGKTMVANSILRLLPPGGRIVGGSVRFDGRDLVHCSHQVMRSIRGNEIGMVFQNPMSSLNPSMTIGAQVAESVMTHTSATRTSARARALEMLGLAGIPRPRERLDEYPHQLSGGLRQRVMIAVALVCEPRLLIADEPTTALDVTIQAQILHLLDRLKQEMGMAILLVTHDMGVIAGRADQVLVMYAGRIVERGRTEEIFGQARHRYTEALLGAIPRIGHDVGESLRSIPGSPPQLTDIPVGCRFAPRCAQRTPECTDAEPEIDSAAEGHVAACIHPKAVPADATGNPARDPAVLVRATAHGNDVTATASSRRVRAASPSPILEIASVTKLYQVRSGAPFQRGRILKAVDELSLQVWSGETLGVVGESGCGKSTLARMIVGLERPNSGEIWFKGSSVHTVGRRERQRLLRDLQLVFQDSSSSLDPRMRVGEIMREPLRIHRQGRRLEQLARVRDLLETVGLQPEVVTRYPHEFSGGQRQRIALARAMALNPAVIVADEPMSALDVSVRAQVLNLMKKLQAGRHLAYVLISHDLAVVRYLADRVAVMYFGKLVELGDRSSVYDHAAHPYTRRLLESVPDPDPAVERRRHLRPIIGEPPSLMHPPPGCPFVTRCDRARDPCLEVNPPLRPAGENHLAACHYPFQPGQNGA